MYAVIKTGGKQHRVKPGDVIEVELMHSSSDTVTFTPLLVVDDDGGTHVGREATKARVTAKLVGEQKGDKVKIFKYRPKTGYAKRAGHRQMYTLIEIQDVSLGGTTSRSKQGETTKKSAKTEKGKPSSSKSSDSTTVQAGNSEPDADGAAESDQPTAEDVGAIAESEAPEPAEAAASDEAKDEAADAGAPEA